MLQTTVTIFTSAPSDTMTQVGGLMSDVMIMLPHVSGEYVCQITSQAGEVLEQTHRLQVRCIVYPPRG